jgi:hypothetical protein
MTKTLPLSQPLKSHDGEIRELVFREPTFADMRKLGFEPVAYARGGADGSLLLVSEKDDVIANYIETLCTNAKPEILLQMCGADALKAKDIVTGFFNRAPAATTNKPSA